MADIFAEFLEQLWDLRISVYTNVASLALLVYDWQLTFGDEARRHCSTVNVIWMSKARLSRLLFLWIRYFGIATHAFIGIMYLLPDPSPTVSDPTKFQIAEPNIMWWSVEFVFALRVWILYKRSRKLLLFLAAMYTVYTCTPFSAVLLLKALVHVELVGIPGGVVTGCFGTVPNFIYGAFIIGNVTTSILCILTVYQTMRFRHEFARSALISLFLRDGVVYYFAPANISGTVVFLLNLFMFRFGTPTFKILFSGFLDVVPCMSGARVLINILSLVRKESGVDETALPYSEPKFVRHPASNGTGLGTTSIGTVAGTSTSGTITVDSNLGISTQFSATSTGSSRAATLSQGAVSVGVGAIEGVSRMGGDDVEKGYD
ncbi:hypothetical protein LXA43DRAFT_877601 [Ganoderma leucocontextum]|nr:hypothetical protein LXA43DRAFT_877601 [Ganoderma leucocontextum]